MDLKKTCTTCNIEKSITEYHKHNRCKFGVRNECKPCRNKRQKQWQIDNRQKYLDYQSNHYKENKDYYYEMAKNNPNRKINKRKEYEKNKKDYLARAKSRKKHILGATPKWADLEKIKEIYRNCPDGYHVDHIIPLRGKKVCGLHVHWNLKILTAKENLQKGNKLWT